MINCFSATAVLVRILNMMYSHASIRTFQLMLCSIKNQVERSMLSKQFEELCAKHSNKFHDIYICSLLAFNKLRDHFTINNFLN